MRGSHRGLGLVEACFAACILGIVLSVFVPRFLNRVRTSKISEAPEQLHAMYLGAASYYAVLRPALGRCLPERAGPTPATPSQDLAQVDFIDAAADGSATWAALGFQPARRTRYSYVFAPIQACVNDEAPTDAIVTFVARGDLDGDGVLSEFEQEAGPSGNSLTKTGPLTVHNRTE